MTWQPKEIATHDTLHLPAAQFLAATLDRNDKFQIGDALPEGWHWAYFLSAAKRSSLGYDGHAEKGDFLPPTDLPRRMWGGSRFEFHAPLRLGETISKRSKVINVAEKNGSAGKLAFITVKHDFFGSDGSLRIEEEHDIVYCEAEKTLDPDKAVVAPQVLDVAQFTETITPDPVLLFRYSALTFNGHRIHYDLKFCREQEGYRNLVVHGPLIATLLLNKANLHSDGRLMRRFLFKARSPLFCDAAFTINARRAGERLKLWAANERGGLAMEAEATFL